MMRIAILGNCQVYGVKHAIKELLPGNTLEEFPLATLSTAAYREQAAERLRDFDLVFSHPLDSKKLSPLQTTELTPHVAKLITFPAISFTGFHPDQVLLYQAGGTTLLNAFGANHSAIIAASFANGLPESRVSDLFNTYIFERLGYFSEYDRSKDFLGHVGLELGFDLCRHFPSWQSMGSFMHTNNHPSIRVLATVARDAVAKAGLCEAENAAVPQVTYDALASVARWPVYPQIADRLSVEGSYNFTKRNQATGLADGEFMLLDEFIFECFKLYRTLPASIFQQEAISFARKVLAAEVI